MPDTPEFDQIIGRTSISDKRIKENYRPISGSNYEPIRMLNIARPTARVPAGHLSKTALTLPNYLSHVDPISTKTERFRCSSSELQASQSSSDGYYATGDSTSNYTAIHSVY
ncbi:hypothetical protein GJ744_002233 [Endocarpon pusillum]|uniref:Uncharacterized protein n=1 Tax=Endocarpon pusillum TaxID=364733 RepID=A0A8H7DYX6_9EURO|nr:hypothetical protein GJ744_002233 [Endocarpon pusillum]